jgi:hypothetical protein
MSRIRDLRREQTAIGHSLWGSTKLVTVPDGVATTTPVDLVRVSVPDDKSAAFTLTVDDDPDNPDVAERKLEVFFGSEGHQVSSGKLDMPRSRMLVFPGSYLRAVATVESCDLAVSTRTFKLGAHAALFPTRSGAYVISSITGTIAPFGVHTQAIPRFARAFTVEQNTTTTYPAYLLEIIGQVGSTTGSIVFTVPQPGTLYSRAVPANAISLQLTNTSPGYANFTIDYEMDF